MHKRHAIIIGAGPAGLTAAYYLLKFKKILTGELLNEPRSDLDVHAGDKIKFGVAQINGQNILIHLPTEENSLA